MFDRKGRDYHTQSLKVTVCIGRLLKRLVHQYARSIKTSLESKTYQTTEEKKVIGIKMFVKTDAQKKNRRLAETCSVRNNLISFNCRTIVIWLFFPINRTKHYYSQDYQCSRDTTASYIVPFLLQRKEMGSLASFHFTVDCSRLQGFCKPASQLQETEEMEFYTVTISSSLVRLQPSQGCYMNKT